MHKMYYYRLSA